MAAAIKVLLRAALVSAALVAAFAHAPPAKAATPCWKQLLNDWYDGRIDQTYEKHCYTEALHHLPADVETYSSARDDIQRALQNAIAKAKAAGRTLGPTSTLGPPAGGKSRGGTGTTGTTTTPTIGRKPGKGLTGVADKLNPSSASSLPLPLLVLGGLAILLVAAGGAGLIAKRIQARRPGT